MRSPSNGAGAGAGAGARAGAGRRSPPRAALAAALGVTLLADAVAYAILLRRPGLPDARLLLSIASVLWVVAVALLARLRPGRRATAVLVLGAGLVLGVVALTHPPSTSDDDFRYAWDAKVQLHGIDPYRYTPASPQLAQLRDPTLFGAPAHCKYAFPGGCTSINRPDVHTIYPPVAEAAFAGVRLASFGGHGQRRPMQVAGLLGSLLVGWLLLRWGSARGRPWLAAVWMWCPIVLTDLVNNAHVDWLAILLIVLAYGVASSGASTAVRRTGWAGALVGAAIATKLYPVLVLPSLLRRHPFAAVGSALAVVVLVYVPHVIAVGSAVIGYLPGYLHEENYASGSRLLLVGWVLPHPVDTVVGAVIVLGVATWAWRRGDPQQPQHSAVVVVGVTLLVFTPSYGWYMALLVALVAMTGAFEWLPLCVAGSFAYLARGGDAKGFYLAALILVLALVVIRRRGRGTRSGAGTGLGNLRACLPWISPSTDPSPSSPLPPRR